MNPDPETIRARLPVWDALSEFFLDTELQPEDYQRIAAILASSPYSATELWEILRFEVYPPCHQNLLCVAGEWGTFGDEWLMERVAPLCGHRPRVYLPFVYDWMFQDHWTQVHGLLLDLRKLSAPHHHIPAITPD